MTAPTLPEVLSALDRDEDPVDFAITARDFILANRATLERWALEQAARKALDMPEGVPVLVWPNLACVPEFRMHARTQLIIVGANWRPEVKL
jgi:hypothetical protein